jgi:hypothetical protein
MKTKSAVYPKSSKLVTKDSVTLTINGGRFKFSVGDGTGDVSPAETLTETRLFRTGHLQPFSGVRTSSGRTIWLGTRFQSPGNFIRASMRPDMFPSMRLIRNGSKSSRKEMNDEIPRYQTA